jgi:hypothetical protein
MNRHLSVSAGILSLVAIIAGAISWYGASLMKGVQRISPVTTPEPYTYTGRVATTREEAVALGWEEMWDTLMEMHPESEVSPVTVPTPSAVGLSIPEAYEALQSYQEQIAFGGYETTEANIAAVSATQTALLDQFLNGGGSPEAALEYAWGSPENYQAFVQRQIQAALAAQSAR